MKKKSLRELELEATLELIAAEMSGKEWDADTCDAIADHVRAAGFEIKDTEEDEES